MTSTAIKVEFDPAESIGSRYVGDCEDGPQYVDMTLQEAVIERAAEMLAKDCTEQARSEMHSRVEQAVQDLVAERLPAIADEALTGEFTVTDEWGRDRSKGTLRDALISYARGQLKHDTRSHSFDDTVLDATIKKHIDYVISSELSGVVKAAKAEVYGIVRTRASEIIAKSVTEGLR